MADIDTDPFGEHEHRPDKPMVPFITGEEGVPTWDPGHEQETSFRGMRNRSKSFAERKRL